MSEKPISPLRRRMIEDMSVRNFVEKTRNDYIRHVRTFTAFLGRRILPRRGPSPLSAASNADRRAPAEHQRLGCGAALPLPLSEMSPEVKVELARLVPCGVTYHEITRDHKIVR